MSPAVRSVPVESNGHDDDDLVPPSPWEVEAWREYERKKIQILSRLETRVDALMTDSRKEVARRIARDEVLDQRHEWHVKALQTLTDATMQQSQNLAAVAEHTKRATGDAREKLALLTEEDVAQDLAIAAAHERNARLEAELNATKAQSALALKLAAWKWTAIAGASATGVLFALRAAGLVHF